MTKIRSFVATSDGIASIRGVDIPIHAGITRVTEDSPLLEQYGHIFEEERSKRSAVEQATAGPGEERA